jgi:hypothetical protein
MWKLAGGISLTLCLFAMAEDTPPDASVSVQCSGRLRHGVVAIGGETTGTTITFDRIVWELQLHDDAQREFAQEHDKEPVVVTGGLRKVAGIEAKVRWIIDVRILSEPDATTDPERARMKIQGTLRATDPRGCDASEMTIEADGQVWTINLSSDSTLKAMAESLVGQPVLLEGSLEQADEKDSGVPGIIRVKTLKESAQKRGKSQAD